MSDFQLHFTGLGFEWKIETATVLRAAVRKQGAPTTRNGPGARIEADPTTVRVIHGVGIDKLIIVRG